MKNKKIYLITGAAGFIGSCMVRELVSRHQIVHVVVRKQSNLWRIQDLLHSIVVHKVDIIQSEKLQSCLKEIQPSIVYHFATNGAYSYQNNAKQIIETNILGTWNLIQACADIQYELFVNIGSSSEYGFKKYAMRETDILEPASYYAVAKSAQTLLCSYIANSQKKPIVTIRPFSVYGPYEESARFIPTLMASISKRKEMRLVSPTIARDYIYVDDFVDLCLRISSLKKYAGEYFNGGTGIQSTIKDVVNTAVAVTGRSTDFVWGSMEKRRWDTANWVGDVSKARQLLNWVPKYTLEKGLRATWKWYQQYGYLYEEEKDI